MIRGIKHGITRIAASEPKTEHQRLEEQKAITEYKALVDLIEVKVREREYTVEVLALTSKLLKANPEYYTIWNVRRRLLIHGFFSKSSDSLLPSTELQTTSQILTTKTSSDDLFSSTSNSSTASKETPQNPAPQNPGKNGKLGTTLDIIKGDLEFIFPLMVSHPKCYWIWSYRLWLLRQANERLKADSAQVLWKRELGLVGKMLTRDSRNFHGWGYRRHVIAQLESPALHGQSMTESEFEYTTRMVSAKLSNFSAWHYRSVLIPKLLNERNADDAARRQFLDGEFDFITSVICTDAYPYDQSAWFYYQFLMTTITDYVGHATVVPNFTKDDRIQYISQQLVNLRDEILDGAEDCKWAYDALLEHTMALCKIEERIPTEDEKQHCKSWLAELRKQIVIAEDAPSVSQTSPANLVGQAVSSEPDHSVQETQHGPIVGSETLVNWRREALYFISGLEFFLTPAKRGKVENSGEQKTIEATIDGVQSIEDDRNIAEQINDKAREKSGHQKEEKSDKTRDSPNALQDGKKNAFDEVEAGTDEVNEAAKQEETEELEEIKHKNESVIEDKRREAEIPPSILEKGIIYFFFRGRVGIEEPQVMEDIARSYIVLRPIPVGAKIGDGPLEDSGNARLLALPKKMLPKRKQDRFLVFVENPKANVKNLKDQFASSDYSTKTAGTSHIPSTTPFAEGVYAITSTGRKSFLAYHITVPEIGEIQRSLGLHGKGSYIVSVKNPETPSPANTGLSSPVKYPESVQKKFRGLRWMPLELDLLDYEKTQILLIGEGLGTLGAVEEQEEDIKGNSKGMPEEEMEKLEKEDHDRVKNLKSDDPVFVDLALSSKLYTKMSTTW
ncbi:hypothetical protein B7494_g3458 [Chlorociboria aeruginascens]|nr:hypothetical protein B7494_g3458 [Chlorociboria aeruginascens]